MREACNNHHDIPHSQPAPTGVISFDEAEWYLTFRQRERADWPFLTYSISLIEKTVHPEMSLWPAPKDSVPRARQAVSDVDADVAPAPP